MKLFLISLTFLFPVLSYGQKFVLNVKTPASLNGDKVFFQLKDNDLRVGSVKFSDSVVIKNDHFSFSGVLTQPCNKASFLINGDKKYSLNFVVDTSINNGELYYAKEDRSLRFLNPGSESNHIKNQIDSMALKEYDDYKKKNNISGSFSLPKQEHHLLDLKRLNILKEYPDNYYSLINLYELSLFASMSDDQRPLILNALMALNENLRSSTLGLMLKEGETNQIKARGLGKEGQTVPKFEVMTLENKLFNNISLKGQPYIIAFSATWCIPCQNQLPVVKQIYKKYHSKGLKVIYFNNDDNVILWKKHIVQDTLTWINVSERIRHGSEIALKLFDVSSIPTYLLIDKNGIIVYNSDQHEQGYAVLGKYVDSLFN